MKRLTLLLIAVMCLGLSPQERTIVEHARQTLVIAKQKAADQQKLIEEQDRENARLDQLSQGQQSQLTKLSGQIETSHKNEETAARYNIYAKPIIDQVNSYWGLGAFSYGFKILARHLLVLVVVLLVITGVLYGLSFAFPAIGVGFRVAWSFLKGLYGRFFKRS